MGRYLCEAIFWHGILNTQYPILNTLQSPLLLMLHRQALAPLPAPTREDLASVLRFAALEVPVHAEPPAPT